MAAHDRRCPLRRRAQQSGARARAQAWATAGAWVAMVLLVLAVQLTSARPDDCALPLDPHGPSFNGLEGERCITWAAVEAAWAAGREKAGLRRPLKEAEGSGGPPLARSLLGTALQEATRLLSERYGLSREEVRELLPRVDTRRTRVRDFCPSALASDQPCAVARFRRYDGRCNNLRHPTWGSAGAPFRRMAPPEYADGVSAPRASRAGFPLPNPRAVSAHVHRDGEHHESAVTLMFVAWGQLVDHDITLTAETKDPETRADPECCGPGTERRHPNCLPVLIPPGDAFYRRHGQTCMNVLRSLAGAREDCRLGPRAQFNQMTSFIDAGFLYGSSEAEARRLRAGRGGRLQMQDAFGPLGLKELLPFKRDFPDEGCLRSDRRRGPLCFLAGDNRANEQLVLTALHTALAREHNRLAEGLALVNPHWGDERVFQEARHIMAAVVQHITYNEFLPMLLGRELTRRYGLVPLDQGFYDGYDGDVDASAASSFVTAAFRFGHSLLPSRVERWSPSHRHVGSQRLSEILKQPFDLLKPGWMDQYLLGLINQPPHAMDTEVTKEVTNHLFQKPSHDYGMDLASINVQRAREHGVPGYAVFRRLCGLGPADRWSALADAFRNGTVRRYHDLYDHPEDVDLWSAGVSERPEPGTMLGATFACLVARTFRDLRRGDRFWYENAGWPSAFTPAQLQEIRAVRLSRILCDTADEILTVQVYAMALPDPESNPRVACRSGVLPRIDLRMWRENPRASTPIRRHLTEDIEGSITMGRVILYQSEYAYDFVTFPRDSISEESGDYSTTSASNDNSTTTGTTAKIDKSKNDTTTATPAA